MFEYGVLLPTRTIYIGGEEIDSTTSERVIKALHLLKAADPRKQITIVVNSMGGSEYDAWAIYDTIKNLRVPVKTVAQGSCMSAATIIFLAGTQRYIGKNCVFMIHDGTDVYEGHKKNVESWAAFGKKYRKYSYQIYYEAIKKKRSRITKADIEKMCEIDTILTAKQTVYYGFAHKLI